MEQKSFSQRVNESIIQTSKIYKKYFIEYEYLICSKAFKNNNFYIISAKKDNFLHLTGVHTNLDATTFFDKCFDGSITESDFDFHKKGCPISSVKGSVREKIISLFLISSIFSDQTYVEENYSKNQIHCNFVSANNDLTLGFVLVGKARPMTILKGNKINQSKASKIDLVLRRKTNSYKFSEIIVGSKKELNQYKNVIGGLLDKELLNLLETEDKSEKGEWLY